MCVPSTCYIAWWNLENLFDEESSPRRTEKLQRAIGADLAGWTPARRDRKVAQLASVIAQMNEAAGPDLLGVCEVENRFVVDLLVGALAARLPARNYAVIHADTEDARGIDVAFIYDAGLLTAPADQVFFHVVMRRNATRELLQVNFKTHKDRTWTVFGNHWPSRSGGRFESAGYRDIAGETLSYFHKRALEIHGAKTPALAMGDFNDEPFDASLVIHALSARQRQRVVEADNPMLWNLSWSVIGDPSDGTFYFNNEPNMLDQFLVNKNMAKQDAAIRTKPDSLQILRFPDTFTGKYRRPKPFGGMGKPVNEDGYSDHFPIGLQVVEID
jgi:predicted extracellular nuclease